MSKALAFALAVALLSACASARATPTAGPVAGEIPFASVDELKDGNFSTGECPDGSTVTIGHIDGRYGLLAIMPRFILIDFDANEVWMGVIEDRRFVVKQRLTLDEVKVKFPSPCQYLAPVGIPT